MTGERRRRRAVGPPGATPPGDAEPRPEPAPEVPGPGDDDRFLSERPPHHEDKG